uniref:Uncharacterized protein n=1 Tax=viral metagenome TaxID=1070528 RepID=A0A6M3Y4Y8_9ZZZZ
MTKTKAIKLMEDNSRAVIDPALARKIAKAFGYSLRDLDISPRRVSTFPRINYTEETKDLSAVSVYHLAQDIAEKLTGIRVKSRMMGMGSHAQDIVEKSVKLINES